MFGFTPIMPMVEQLTPYNTAGAAGALASNRNAYMTHEDRQASLAENQRQFNEELPLQQFKTFAGQYNENRQQNEIEAQHDEELLKWIHNLITTDPAAAEKSAPFLHGILQSRGINMDWDSGTGSAAPGGEAPVGVTSGATGAASIPRGSGAAAAGMSARTAPSADTEPSQEAPIGVTAGGAGRLVSPISSGASAIAEASGIPQKNVAEPPPPKNEDEALAQLDAAQKASAAHDMEEDKQKPQPELPAETRDVDRNFSSGIPIAENAQMPGESLIHWMQRTRPQAHEGAEPISGTPQMEPIPLQNGLSPKMEPVPNYDSSHPPEMQLASLSAFARGAANAGPPSAPAQPPPGQGRWVFSKNGKELGAINIADIKQFQGERARGVAEGFATGAMPAADRPFIEGMTKRMVAQGFTPDQVQFMLKNIVQPELDRRSRERGSYAMAAAKGQSGVGPERLDLDLYKAGQVSAREPIDRYPKLKEDMGSYQSLKNAMDLFQNGKSGVDTAAAYRYLALALNKGALSDKDAVAPELFLSWSDKVMRFMSTGIAGDLTPEEKANLVANVQRKLGQIESQAHQVYDQLIESAQGNTMYDQPRYRQGYANELKMYSMFPFYDQKQVDSVLRGTPPVPAGGGGGGGKTSTSVKGSLAAPEMAKPPVPKNADEKTKQLLNDY